LTHEVSRLRGRFGELSSTGKRRSHPEQLRRYTRNYRERAQTSRASHGTRFAEDPARTLLSLPRIRSRISHGRGNYRLPLGFALRRLANGQVPFAPVPRVTGLFSNSTKTIACSCPPPLITADTRVSKWRRNVPGAGDGIATTSRRHASHSIFRRDRG